ncbi:hypothetical protein [Adhaeretor mobilis]|nr:hypothetical protein [Adhaeretor mobilis]
MPRKKPLNPFYLALIPVGTVFVVTAFIYGYMAFQMVNAAADAAKQAAHPLFAWMRAHGNTLLLVELAVLAVLTFGAMALESRQDRKDE